MKTFEKPLSAQEEKELLINLREGDSAARNVLIEKNMRLVAHIVKNIPLRNVIILMRTLFRWEQ